MFSQLEYCSRKSYFSKNVFFCLKINCWSQEIRWFETYHSQNILPQPRLSVCISYAMHQHAFDKGNYHHEQVLMTTKRHWRFYQFLDTDKNILFTKKIFFKKFTIYWIIEELKIFCCLLSLSTVEVDLLGMITLDFHCQDMFLHIMGA